MPQKIKVNEVMVESVVTINEGKGVKKAAKLMEDEDVGCLIVLNKDNVSGMVTSTDLVRDVIANDMKPSEVKIDKIMTRDIKTISPGKNIFEATKILLKQKIKRLPVVRGEQLVGIISYKDILKVTPELNDFLLEKAHKEELEERYGNKIYNETEENICEECGNFSEELQMVDGHLLCEECREESSIV